MSVFSYFEIIKLERIKDLKSNWEERNCLLSRPMNIAQFLVNASGVTCTLQYQFRIRGWGIQTDVPGADPGFFLKGWGWEFLSLPNTQKIRSSRDRHYRPWLQRSSDLQGTFRSTNTRFNSLFSYSNSFFFSSFGLDLGPRFNCVHYISFLLNISIGEVNNVLDIISPQKNILTGKSICTVAGLGQVDEIFFFWKIRTHEFKFVPTNLNSFAQI
jgi:hypothetical protein